ncbi:MAG: NAD(P)H-quinone oxidoreductase [Rhodospirillales bacterium]|jgi:NADPH2:quinone reductase|nr:NAD(P)H-quinone oxidoreductase [Rhodospirillales bacterium]MDP6885108.1 NAD(P)H-quinone oxidoreductase [Rhodospirillales bacterium]
MTASLPETMTCVEVGAPGGPEVLKTGTRPLPRPGPGQVLIKVAAAGVNRVDTFQRMGNYPVPDGATDLLGLEIAGEVVARDDAVAEWSLGDRVCALVAGGGYAQYCPVPAAHCLPIPKGLDLVEAASLPETYFTVWTNVFERAALQPGETLLVHGGSSGIGVAAIQLAKNLDSPVAVTAGSAEKCAACRSLGADLAVNYRTDDFVAAVRDFTQDKGIDVILDMVGGDYVARNIEALAIEGRLVYIAFLDASRVEVDLRPMMVKRLAITGSTLRPLSDERKAAIAATLRKRIWPLIDTGRIKPVVHATFPLAQAAEAHRLMESSAHIGKIMLSV